MPKLALLFLFLAVAIRAHAEDGCPPGQRPDSATDIHSCGPIPNYQGQQNQQEQLPPRIIYVRTWGAIATDDAHGALGSVIGRDSMNSAQKAAIADCQARGGKDCIIRLAYDNQCAAAAAGKTRLSISSDVTIDQAKQKAMTDCSEHSEECRVILSACSIPGQGS